MGTLQAEKKGRRPARGERLAQHALMACLFLLALYLIGHMHDGLPARDRATESVAYRRAREFLAFTLSQHMLGGGPDAQRVVGDCQTVAEIPGQFRCQGTAEPLSLQGRRLPLVWQCLMCYQDGMPPDQGPPWRCVDLFIRGVEGARASAVVGTAGRP